MTSRILNFNFQLSARRSVHKSVSRKQYWSIVHLLVSNVHLYRDESRKKFPSALVLMSRAWKILLYMFRTAVFNWVSKVIRVCIGFALLSSVIGLQHPCQSLTKSQGKTKSDCVFVARVFPLLATDTSISLEFWFVHWVLVDWLE